MRQGGATTAFMAGVPLNVIQLQGGLGDRLVPNVYQASGSLEARISREVSRLLIYSVTAGGLMRVEGQSKYRRMHGQ